MALGYLSKALSRASPLGPTGGLSGMRATTRTASPLAEEDQRLHDLPETFAPGAPVTSLGDTASEAPAPPVAAVPLAPQAPRAAEGPQSIDVPAQDVEPAKPELAPPARGDEAGAVHIAASPPDRHSERDFPSDKSRQAVDAQRSPAGPDNPQPKPPPDDPARPASPEQVLSQALSRAEAWIAGGDTPNEEDPIPALADLFDPGQAPPPPSGQTSEPLFAVVEPVLPARFDMSSDAQPAPPPPQVEIGSIEVEIVPPPAAPKPVKTAPQRSQPFRSPPAPVAPYGWRQR